jgi:hypothetical protein
MNDSTLITDEYRALNRQLHESNQSYGTSGHRWAPLVRHLVQRHRLADVLDYGCGKQTLARALPGIKVHGYDPAFAELSATPAPADLVVCGDVLEHVEPQQLEAVFDDLARCTRRLAFLVVATRPARKTLPDGRNAHLSQMSASRWLEKVLPRFDVLYMSDHFAEFDDDGLVSKVSRWALRDVRMAAPQHGEVVFLVAARADSGHG